MLREFNHVNPQDDVEGKEFSDTRVSIRKDSNPDWSSKSFCLRYFVPMW